MNISFAKNAWNLKDLTYAYSWRFEETPVFVQKEDCVESSENPAVTYGFDNISLLTREKYMPNVTFSTQCAFDSYGAPLLVIAKDMELDARGVYRYGEYMEFVLWEKGLNVWRMWYKEGKVTWKLLLGAEFPVSCVKPHPLSVTIKKDMLEIDADGHVLKLRIEDMYESFHLGLDACEGINRFYDFVIEKEKEQE